MPDASAAYLSEAVRSLHAYKKLAEGALAQISDDEFFRKPDPESLSCALLVKHIAGNLRSRFTDFLTSDGLVVTPSRSPVSCNSLISAISAVSTKNFMVDWSLRLPGNLPTTSCKAQ